MKSKIIYTITAIGILIISVFITVKLIKSKPVPRANEQTQNLLNVKATIAKNTNFDSNVKYRGRISSYENISLSAEVSGKIMQGNVHFKAGQEFKKNDLLIQIYNEDIKASLMSAKSSFMRTLSAILPDIRIDFPEEYDKWKDFFSLVNVDKKLPVLPETKTEKEQIFLASKGVLTEYYLLRQREINIKKYTIYAPFNGSFKSISREIGAIANMGAELASIIRTDKLEVIVPVLPVDVKWIKSGDQVNLIGTNNIKSGKVSRISNFVDASTQSINVYVDYYPNGDNSLLIGEFVDVEFNISKKVIGIMIPREALLNNNQVYIIHNKMLKSKSVQIERSLNDSFIISGIIDGETVVIESLADVSEGTKVNVRN